MRTTISVADRGFTLGDGVFDTAIAVNGRMIARERHLDRLMDAAGRIGIAIARERIEAAIDEVLDEAPSILRTTVTRGTAARGLWPGDAGEPTLIVTRAPWSAEMIGQPARLVTATGRRNEFSPTSQLKTLGYLDNILAAREAAEAGADDALILNTRGNVACSTIANVFIVRGNRLVTPPTDEGCLPGIVRGQMLACAHEMGLVAEEASLGADDLLNADAVLLTNSVRLVRLATRLDGRQLQPSGDGIAAFHKVLGKLRADISLRC